MAKQGRRRQLQRRAAPPAPGTERPSFTVADRDIADRAQALLRSFESEVPDIWTELEAVRAEVRTEWGWEWPEWCWLPDDVSWLWAYRCAVLGGAWAGPAELEEWKRTQGRDELAEKGMEVSQLTAAASWRVTRGIYRFHPELRRALTQTPVEDVAPELLLRLPEWCVYVDLDAGEEFPEGHADGFYAYVDWRDLRGEKTAVLRLLSIEARPELRGGLLCDLPLRHRTLAEAWSEMAPSTYGLEAVTESKWRSALRVCLPLLVYLVSQEPDVGHRRDPGRRPSRSRPERDPGGPNWWEVGYRVGAVLGRARERGAGRPPAAGAGTARSPAPHVRRGHYHLYWTGPGRREPQVRWLHPMLVGDLEGHELPPTVRKVRQEEG